MKKLMFIIAMVFAPLGSLMSVEHSFSLSLTDNYVLRGLSKTNDELAIQADYQLFQSKKSGYYAGLFASNVSSGAEIDLYGGIKTVLDGFYGLTFDFGAVEYFYTDISFHPIWHEFYYGLSKNKTYAKFYYGEGDAHYLDLGTQIPIVNKLDLSLHYGHTFGSTVIGEDVSVGLIMALNTSRLALMYSSENRSVNNESRVYFTVAKNIDW